jgi:uncharacterized protein YceK
MGDVTHWSASSIWHHRLLGGLWASIAMRLLNLLLLVCAIFCAGCSAVGTRIVGDRYFSGVRADYSMVFDRSSVDPDSRVHPALAVLDAPFSLVGDVLFLPYDAYQECTSSPSTNTLALASPRE